MTHKGWYDIKQKKTPIYIYIYSHTPAYVINLAPNDLQRLMKTIKQRNQPHIDVRGEFNKFLDFFVQAFKIAVDSWTFTMLLLYILWDDWPIFMISDSNG